MSIIEFVSLVKAIKKEFGWRPYAEALKRERRYEKMKRLRGRTREQYLSSIRKYPPGTKLQRQKAILTKWVAQNGGGSAHQKRLKYINWWKKVLFKLGDDPSLAPTKRKRSQEQLFVHNVRSRLRLALKRKIGTKTYHLIGCTPKFLMSYLESKFTHTMSWSNYGPIWHIDHIIPLSKFNLRDPKQLSQACHYSNLQPLLVMDNITKSNRIPHPTQTHLPIQLPDSITTYPARQKRSQKKLGLIKIQ